MKKLLAEFIGTFFLVYVIASTGDPLAIGVILMIMIYALGPVSGGHFNPAVTLGVLMSKTIDGKTAAKYMGVQFLGALVASAVFFLLNGAYFAPTMAPEVLFSKALIIEIIFTFALVFVVLNVAVNPKVKGNQYFGLAIGLTVFVGATSAAAVSGAVFNPAVGVSAIIFNVANLGSNLTNLALYIVGPFLGSLLAITTYKIMNKKGESN